MKTIPFLTCLLAMTALSLGMAQAQNHPAKNNEDATLAIVVGDSTRSREVIDVFIQNAPKAFTAPHAPRFAIIGKDRKFYLGIGGYAKTTVSFDWGNPISNATHFTTSSIPMHGIRKGDGGLLQFSAATSNIFANFVAMPGDDNQLGVYINGNFLGNGYGFELTYAYLTYRGITAGYNYSLFSDMAAAPPTIDYENAPGFTAIPNMVVDYVYDIDPHWSVGIGAEMPIASATTNEYTYLVNQRIPDIPAYVQFAWDEGSSWLRVSGILRNMQYRDIVADKNRTKTAWGVKASGSWNFYNRLIAYYQAAYGQGITSYFQDLYEGGLDLVPDAADNGRLSNVEAWGGYFGLQYNLTRTTFLSCTYSQVRDYADRYNAGTTLWNEQYKYAQYLVANMFWNLTPNLQMGVEYLWGRRVNMDGNNHHDNRLQAMMQLNF